MRGTLRFSNQPTAGPATAPSTEARITGMTIVDVSPSSQMTPTMISTKPTSSHEEKPRSLNHVGAENCALRSVDIPSSCRSGCFRPASMRGGHVRSHHTVGMKCVRARERGHGSSCSSASSTS